MTTPATKTFKKITEEKRSHSTLSKKYISRIAKSVKRLKRAKLTPALRKAVKQ